MSPAVWAALAAAAIFLLVAVFSVGAATGARRAAREARVRESERAARTEEELVLLRARVDELGAARREDSTEDPAEEPVEQAVGAPFVITDAGRPAVPGGGSGRVVLSAALGEPLVRAVAFGHGLRHALSPETRNRIAFHVRREVRRARKERRRAARRARLAAARAGVATVEDQEGSAA